MKPRSSLNRSGYTGLALAFISLILNFPAWAVDSPLAQQISTLAAEYHSQMNITPREMVLTAALSKAAESWCLTAMDMAAGFNNQSAQAYLKSALAIYQKVTAEAKGQKTPALAGLNLLYQTLDAMAVMAAEKNQDQKALASIRTTENRILGVVQHSGEGGPTLAALSGGVMTMLAILAGQVDVQNRMTKVLEDEFRRRREVDLNISRLTDIEPEKRILLLTNNHLQGAFSMVQIIGLIRQPVLKPKLAQLETELIKAKDADLETQLVAGAKALAEAGFAVCPALADFAPATPPAPPSKGGPEVKISR